MFPLDPSVAHGADHTPVRRRCVLRTGLGLVLGAAGVGESPAWALDAAEAADRLRTKVVVLKSRVGDVRGNATGFLARPGLVVTAGHFVRDNAAIVAWLNGVGYRARLKEMHPSHDLALLSLDAPSLYLKPADLAPTAGDLRRDEPLVILTGPSQPANARGEPDDRISLLARFEERRVVAGAGGRPEEVLAMAGSVRRGDSGSPVARVRDGRVIGVLIRRDQPEDGDISLRAYAVPVEHLARWLDRQRPDGDEEFYLRRF